MGRRSVTIDPTGERIALTLRNAGVRDRLEHRETTEDAARTLGRWGLKFARKHVDAAVEAGRAIEVRL